MDRSVLNNALGVGEDYETIAPRDSDERDTGGLLYVGRRPPILETLAEGVRLESNGL